MAATRFRRRPNGINIWAGFVDALASLLLVIIFVLLAFVLTQFQLGQMLTGRDQTISRLSRQLNDLTDMLDVERRASAELKVNIGRLTEDLQTSMAERDRLQADVNQNAVDRQQMALLQHDLDALKALRDQLEKKVAELGAEAGQAQGQVNWRMLALADMRLSSPREMTRWRLSRLSAVCSRSAWI